MCTQRKVRLMTLTALSFPFSTFFLLLPSCSFAYMESLGRAVLSNSSLRPSSTTGDMTATNQYLSVFVNQTIDLVPVSLDTLTAFDASRLSSDTLVSVTYLNAGCDGSSCSGSNGN